MSENSCKKEIKKTSIGGQALIEGVMMKGPRISAMAIRQQNGEIITETWDSGGNKWYHKVPILRGIFNFIGMLGQGYKCLMRSADLSGFTVPDEFVVGYGLDYAQQYRNVPYIGVLKPEVYTHG